MDITDGNFDSGNTGEYIRDRQVVESEWSGWLEIFPHRITRIPEYQIFVGYMLKFTGCWGIGGR